MKKKVAASHLNLGEHGAERMRSVMSSGLESLAFALDGLPADQAGIRLSGEPRLRSLLSSEGPIGALAAAMLGPACRAVRAVLFDKSAKANWSLQWHQDRTICVCERRDVEGFGPWTVKDGMHHVTPPFELLARMLTLRVHIDDVTPDNAPLLIAPGSHLAGRIPLRNIETVVRKYGEFTCLADAGDVWAYSTPILHASKAASKPQHRRVLQVDFSSDTLPGGLDWLGV